MQSIRNILITAIIVLTLTGVAAAQTEAGLKQYFEGKSVQIKIDMPATKNGINVRLAKEQPIDYDRYNSALKYDGVAIHKGDYAVITKIKTKDKHIEFQLDGGGFGTRSDESDSIYVPQISKSDQEKNLEKDLKNEKDERQRWRISDEINRLRRQRERQYEEKRREADVEEEKARLRIQEIRLHRGSRFNIHFPKKMTAADLTPETIKAALAEYVYFSGFDR